MIISNPIISSVRAQDGVRRGAADDGALPAVAADSQLGQAFMPAEGRVAPSGQLAQAPFAPSFDNESIDLRVLNAAPVSRPEQRAINAYQSTAQLGSDFARATFGLDETA
jgi:hypothetical protein